MILSRPINSSIFTSLNSSLPSITRFRTLISRPPTPEPSGAAHQLFDVITHRALHPQEHPGPSPSTITKRRGDPTISRIIRTITRAASVGSNSANHTSLIKTGLDSEISIATALIGLYSSLRDLGSARCMFDATPAKDLILWSAMVTACCKNEEFSLAIDIFNQMQHCGNAANIVSLLAVLPACANAGALVCGKQIHGWSVRREFAAETSLQNSLVDMYAKCGKLDCAVALFNAICLKDDISWRSIIFGCIANAQPREALTVFSKMRSSHVEPDKITIQNVIGVCSLVGDVKIGLELHCFVVKSGLVRSASVGTTLLRMYAEFKDVESARELFDQLLYKDVIAWSAMVSVYANSRHPILAIKMFKRMQVIKEEINERVLVSLLQACSLMEAQELGRSIHAHVTRLEYAPNVYLTSALIDFYCKVGGLRKGRILFEKTQKKDIVCWSSMIHGYGTNGSGEDAIRTFYDMLEDGLMPNKIVFVSLLSACGHCGLVDECWKWFNSMTEKFGIDPTLEHYTCIVNMLGRQGQVEEALKFIETMPMEPDVGLWSSLLSWCRTADGDFKVAEIVAEQLIRLDPDNTSHYVTLSNIYSDLRQWGDAEKTRGLMEEKGLKKTAGYSKI